MRTIVTIATTRMPTPLVATRTIARIGHPRMPTIGGIYIPEPARPGLGSILGATAQGAYGQVRYGLPYQAAKLSGNISSEDEAFYQRGLAESGAAAVEKASADYTLVVDSCLTHKRYKLLRP